MASTFDCCGVKPDAWYFGKNCCLKKPLAIIPAGLGAACSTSLPLHREACRGRLRNGRFADKVCIAVDLMAVSVLLSYPFSLSFCAYDGYELVFNGILFYFGSDNFCRGQDGV